MFSKLQKFGGPGGVLVALVATLAVIPIAACANSPDRVACHVAKDGRAESTILDLYENYSWKSGQSIQNQSSAELSKYFDENLVRLFEEDMRCRIEEEGICKIDFSLLYFAQDFDISDFKVCAMDKDTREVDVFFNNMGNSRKVRFLMLRTDDDWKVSDVIYSNGLSLVDILEK